MSTATDLASFPATSIGPRPFATTRYELASPPSGEHFRFATSSRSGDGLFRFVWTLAPGKKGPGEHQHPHETESFEIVSGTLRIWIDGVPTDFGPGEKVAIPPGTTHSFLNPGTVPVVVNVHLDGPRMEDTFLPCAVANAERETIGNLLRFMVTTPIHDASVATPGVAASIATAVVRMLQLFGVKPFPPVYGWDGERQAGVT